MLAMRFLPRWFLLASVVLSIFSANSVAAPQAQESRDAGQAQMQESYGRLPLSFEANAGQTESRVKFLSKGSGYGIYLTSDEAVLALRRRKCSEPHTERQAAELQRSAHVRAEAGCNDDTDVVRMSLAGGAKESVSPVGEELLPGTANYFVGSNPAAWRAGVPTFGKVKYSGVYPGVDLIYFGNQRQLEYDFAVAPNADASAIRLQFSGASKLTLSPTGDLIVGGKNGDITFRKPVVYQDKDGHRNLIAGRFTLGRRHTVSFTLGDYDHSWPLIIDPVLVYSTYLGGSGTDGDAALAIAVDSSGEAYVTGQTDSSNFPVSSGAIQTTDNATSSTSYNAFVTKLNAAGTSILYSTYLGGSGNTQGTAIAVDSNGDAYVGGHTFSTDFPITTGAYQTSSKANASGYTGFVSKLNSTGTALVYSTYLGGSGNGGGTGESAFGLALDGSGNAYVVGSTDSADFPTTSGAFQTTDTAAANQSASAFVTKLNATGTALGWSTFLGGSGPDGGGDVAYAVAVSSSGNVFVTGSAGSTDFPVTSGAYQTANPAAANSQTAAFVTEFNSTGTAQVYSTYLGGSKNASGAALAVDAAGDAYVAGYAMYTDFPVTTGAYQTSNGAAAISAGNGFVTKLNPSGTALLYSTWLGGSGVTVNAYEKNGDSANGIAIDALGDAYVTGVAWSTNFPVTSGAIQSANAGAAHKSSDAFVAEFNPSGTALIYSTYLGGSGYPFGTQGYYRGDQANGLALDTAANVYVAGQAYSVDYPNTSGAYQMNNFAAGTSGSNAFVSKISSDLIGTTTTLTPSANPVGAGTSVTFTANVAAVSGSTTPTGSVVFAVDGTTAATVALSAGAAAYATSNLAAGQHSVTASYPGGSGFNSSTSSTLTETINPATATPTFSPAAGTYTTTQSVALSDTTSSASIYYTTDGTQPSTSSTKYSAAIQVSATTTINAIAQASGLPQSPMASASFQIVPAVAATITSPTAGTSLVGPSVTFTWGTAAGVTAYELYVGSTGAGSNNLYSSGSKTVTSLNVAALPTNGETIYVRLLTNFSGSWQYADYTYTAAMHAVLTSPAPGGTFGGPNVTFTWTPATGNQVTGYRFYLGSTGVGSNNLYSSALQTGTSFSAIALPTNGETIYARVLTDFNGTWGYADYTYTAVTKAQLTSPTAGGLLPGRTVTFKWSAATGGTAYELWLGDTGVGSNNLYNSLRQTVTSITVGGLPDNGETIYARVLTDFNGSWASIDYTFTAVTAPVMSAPSNGGLLAGPTVTFTWTGGVGASAYELYVGSTGAGSNNLYSSGSKTVTSLAVSNLPTNGETVYVRLLTNFNGSWSYSDYTYTAATHALIATPASGSTLAGAAVTFTLTPATGTEATAYELWLGSTGAGSSDLYSSGQTTATSFNVKSLPTNGETIYARVLTNFGGTWGYIDTTYVAQ
jgi:hypothetical protein